MLVSQLRKAAARSAMRRFSSMPNASCSAVVVSTATTICCRGCHTQGGRLDADAVPSSCGGGELDEDMRLPAHLLAPVSSSLTAEDVERGKKTAQFIKAVCTVPDVQESVDMICAAMKHHTLRDRHVLAIMRQLKILDAEYRIKKQNAVDVPTAVVDTTRTATAIAERKAPSMSPARRMLALVEVILFERYHKVRADPSDAASRIKEDNDEDDLLLMLSPKVYTDFLLWMLDPYVRQVKAAALQDYRGVEEDDAVENPASGWNEFTPKEVWTFAANLEVHNVHIESEVALDALLLALKHEDAIKHRHSGSGDRLHDDLRKNRIEFVDMERSWIRDRLLKGELRRQREVSASSTGGVLRRRGPATPHRETKLSEVSPPPE